MQDGEDGTEEEEERSDVHEADKGRVELGGWEVTGPENKELGGTDGGGGVKGGNKGVVGLAEGGGSEKEEAGGAAEGKEKREE